MRALRSSPGVGAVSASSLAVVDDDEVGVAPGQPHLDVPGGQLGVERQRGVREDVEEAKLERCRDGSGEALACRGRRLVAERGGRREVCLDCVNVPVDVHGPEYDIKMMSVKCEIGSHCDVSTDGADRVRCPTASEPRFRAVCCSPTVLRANCVARQPGRSDSSSPANRVACHARS